MLVSKLVVPLVYQSKHKQKKTKIMTNAIIVANDKLNTVNMFGESYLFWSSELLYMINTICTKSTEIVKVFGCVVTTDAGTFVVNPKKMTVKAK